MGKVQLYAHETTKQAFLPQELLAGLAEHTKTAARLPDRPAATPAARVNVRVVRL